MSGAPVVTSSRETSFGVALSSTTCRPVPSNRTRYAGSRNK